MFRITFKRMIGFSVERVITSAEKLIDKIFALVPRTKPQNLNVKETRITAHRGAHYIKQGIIENTLAAFDLAQEIGCWGIEFDVQATADNVLVVNHDPTLNRLWGYDVAIADLSFYQLRILEPRIPSLAEVVSAYGGKMHLFIELKAPFTAENALVQTLNELTPCKDYHLLTLDHLVFHTLSTFPKQSLLLVAGVNNVGQFCTISLNEQYGGVLGHYLLFTNKKIQKLKAANQLAGVGFVDSKYSLYRELTRGITYLFTNRSVEISQYMKLSS